jgi:hypothetical protein
MVLISPIPIPILNHPRKKGQLACALKYHKGFYENKKNRLPLSLPEKLYYPFSAGFYPIWNLAKRKMAN